MIKPDNFVTSQSLFILDEALNLIVQIRRLGLNKNPFYKRLNTCVYRGTSQKVKGVQSNATTIRKSGLRSSFGKKGPEIIERDAQSGNWACKSWDCFDYWDDDKSAKKVPSPIRDSNSRPLAWQSSLLTTIPRRFTYFECSHTTIYRALPSSHYTLALLGPRWRGISILRCSVKVHELLFLILTRNHRFLWSEMSIKHSRCVAFKCQVNF